jgi:hypothetical protein
VRHFRDLATAGADEHALRERRGLHLSTTLNGITELAATLDPESGEVVRTAIHAFTDPPVDGDRRTPGQRRCDALRRVAEAALATLGTDEDPPRARPHVAYTVGHETLLDGRLGVCDGEFSGPVGRETMRRILCDSVVSRVVTGPGSVILDAGRSRRVVSTAQRRALVVRDQGCRYPGCGRPPGWTRAHHVRHWLDGGPTDLANLVLLCDFHHDHVHANRLVLALDDHGLRVSEPDGHPLAA